MLPILVTLQYVTDGKNHVMDRLAREEKGATAVEYGLLIGLVAVVLVGALALIGTGTDSPIAKLVDGLKTKMTI